MRPVATVAIPSRFASSRNPRTRASCDARISGPQSRSANAGPAVSDAKRSPSKAEQPLVQRSLDEEPRACAARLAGVLDDRVDSAGNAASISASANTTCGDLPPSSSVTGQCRCAAAAATPAPVAGDPVNDR
jgi:hypothetical protein